MMIKNILSKVALLNLGIVLSFNSAQAMDTEEREDGAISSVPLSQKENLDLINLGFDGQVYVLKQLSVQDLGRCAQVCKGWKEISSGDYLWGKMAKNHTSSGGLLWIENLYNTSWKETMRISFPKDKKLKERKKEWLSDPYTCDKPYPSLQVFLISHEDPSAFQKSFKEIQEFKTEIKEKIRDLESKAEEH